MYFLKLEYLWLSLDSSFSSALTVLFKEQLAFKWGKKGVLEIFKLQLNGINMQATECSNCAIPIRGGVLASGVEDCV